MTTTTATTTISGAASSATKTAQQKAGLANNFSDFLTLLTTQLQNQDPLAPMDSNEFTNQLVQFSQVEQQINSNQKLDNLVSLLLSSSINSALGYVGLDANYVSNELSYDGTTPGKITYSLNGTATSAKLSILDKSGDVVFSKDISGNAGRDNFTWDGTTNTGEKAEAGTYTIQIGAIDADNKPVTSSVVVQGHVRGVETQDGVVHLLIGDRAVPLSNVLNAALPETVSETSTTNQQQG